jgi:hypothetical protein
MSGLIPASSPFFTRSCPQSPVLLPVLSARLGMSIDRCLSRAVDCGQVASIVAWRSTSLRYCSINSAEGGLPAAPALRSRRQRRLVVKPESAFMLLHSSALAPLLHVLESSRSSTQATSQSTRYPSGTAQGGSRCEHPLLANPSSPSVQ